MFNFAIFLTLTWDTIFYSFLFCSHTSAHPPTVSLNVHNSDKPNWHAAQIRCIPLNTPHPTSTPNGTATTTLQTLQAPASNGQSTLSLAAVSDQDQGGYVTKHAPLWPCWFIAHVRRTTDILVSLIGLRSDWVNVVLDFICH